MPEKGKTKDKIDCDNFKVGIIQENVAKDDASPSIVPPDGGWGWIVVSVSFVTNFMCWGILLSSGVFLEEFCVVIHQFCLVISVLVIKAALH